MTVTTSYLVRDGGDAVDFVSDRIQAAKAPPVQLADVDPAGIAGERARPHGVWHDARADERRGLDVVQTGLRERLDQLDFAAVLIGPGSI
jgi:hypothetical protein